MKDYGPESFGELNAENYDAEHDPGTTDDSVALLAKLANGKKTLELAIGTGRVALPLAACGIDISGIEASPDMVTKMREKPGGKDIPVAIGDMACFELGDRFDFAFLIFNTLFNLTSQEAQISCFKSTAAHLNSGGAFLIETFVPDLSQYTGNQALRTRHVDAKSAWIEAIQHDPVNQIINYQRIRFSKDGMRLVPLPMRYAWPQEIDLMAKFAGLTLEARWGGWLNQPFSAHSRMHVSLYRKP